ncbi:MAG: HlyD family efflux transporter periplasmic adaptor subunit [Bacteroidota bacterium]
MQKLSAAILLVLLVWSCGGTDAPTETVESQQDLTDQAEQPIRSDLATEIVEPERVERPIRFTGRVIPLQEATISSQVPGLVLPTEKILQAGKYYRQGETMIRIDDEQLRYTLQAERSQLVSAIVRLLSDMSLDYPAQHPIWEAFVNDIQADEMLPDLPKIEDQQFRYFINAAGIPAQYYGIKAREVSLDDYTVRAPFSGKLTMADVDPGSFVQPGQPLARISRTDVYEMEASLPANGSELIREGQEISLYSSSLDRSFEGRVHRLGTAIDPGTQSLIVYVRVSGEGIRSGLYLEGEIAGQTLEEVYMLPKDALGRDQSVYVVDTDGIAQSQEVELILVESDQVFVRGLEPRTEVIIEQVDSPIAGSRVK